MENPLEHAGQNHHSQLETIGHHEYYQTLYDYYQSLMDHHQIVQDNFETVLNSLRSRQGQQQALDNFHREIQTHHQMVKEYRRLLEEHSSCIMRRSIKRRFPLVMRKIAATASWSVKSFEWAETR